MSEDTEIFNVESYSCSIIGDDKDKEIFQCISDKDARLIAAMDEIAKQIKRDIVIDFTCWPKKIKEPNFEVDFNKLYIYPHAAQGNTKVSGGVELPEEVTFLKKKFPLYLYQRDLILYTGNYQSPVFELKDDSKNYPLAKFSNQIIWFAFDVLHLNPGSFQKIGEETDEAKTERVENFALQSIQLFVNIVSSVVQHMLDNGMMFDVETRNAEKIKKLNDNYRKLYEKQIAVQIDQLKKKKQEICTRIEDIEKDLTLLTKDFVDKSNELKIMESSMTIDATIGTTDIFKNLMDTFYSSIEFNEEEDEIIAITKPIHTKYRMSKHDPMRIYRIGCMKITIPLELEKVIVAENLNPIIPNGRHSPIHHPHIQQYGICWGNMAKFVPKLRVECNFSVLLQVLAQFFFTVKHSDTYNSCTMFPDVTEQFDEKLLEYDNTKVDEKKMEQAATTIRRRVKKPVEAEAAK